jgi:hypothetical protein
MAADAISINIWDDYCSDGYVPDGAVQETYAYVEDDLSDEDSREVLELLRVALDSARVAGSTFESCIKWHDSAELYPSLVGAEHERYLYKRWQLELRGLPHQEREQLVERLSQLDLRYKGAPLDIYSES